MLSLDHDQTMQMCNADLLFCDFQVLLCPATLSLRLLLSDVIFIWARAWQNQQNDLCALRRLRSAWASAHSDHSLRLALHGWPRNQGFFMRTAKTLIRLGGCPGWSEASLGAQINLLVLLCSGSYSNRIKQFYADWIIVNVFFELFVFLRQLFRNHSLAQWFEHLPVTKWWDSHHR